MMAKGRARNDLDVANAIGDAQDPQDDLITLSTGVVLRAKPANPTVLITVMAAVPQPEVPTYYNSKMGRDTENPDDPVYLERLQAWRMDYSDRLVSAMIALGTEFVSAPKGLGKPKLREKPEPPMVKKNGRDVVDPTDPGYQKRLREWKEDVLWLEEYSLLRVPMNPDNEFWAYLTWVKFKGMKTDKDMQAIMEAVGRLSGVREKTVQSAEDFPGSDETAGKSGS